MSQVRRGVLELCVLNILGRESLHGYGIVKRRYIYAGLVLGLVGVTSWLSTRLVSYHAVDVVRLGMNRCNFTAYSRERVDAEMAALGFRTIGRNIWERRTGSIWYVRWDRCRVRRHPDGRWDCWVLDYDTTSNPTWATLALRQFGLKDVLDESKSQMDGYWVVWRKVLNIDDTEL